MTGLRRSFRHLPSQEAIRTLIARGWIASSVVPPIRWRERMGYEDPALKHLNRLLFSKMGLFKALTETAHADGTTPVCAAMQAIENYVAEHQGRRESIITTGPTGPHGRVVVCRIDTGQTPRSELIVCQDGSTWYWEPGHRKADGTCVTGWQEDQAIPGSPAEEPEASETADTTS